MSYPTPTLDRRVSAVGPRQRTHTAARSASVLLLPLLCVAFFLLRLEHARADTLEVCKSGCRYPAIRAALAVAQPGDTVWVRAGTYRESEAVRLKPGVTLRGEDPQHPEWTIILADGGNAVVGTGDVLTTTCVLEGFTITNANGRGIYIQNEATEIIRNNIISGCVTSFKGAAIRIDDEETRPTIQDNVFINNHSSDEGGAIYVHDASPLLVGNRFIHNVADRDGGALAIRTVDRPGQQAQVIDNVFQENQAAAKGGAIYVEHSQPIVRGNQLIANRATSGGGIFVNGACSAGRGLLQGNRLEGNTTLGTSATSVGGALALAGGADCDVDANTILDNRAGLGDGIHVQSATPRLSNNILIRNPVQLLVRDASPDIVNNTLLGDHGSETVGIELLGSSAPNVANNIIAFAGIGIRSDGLATPVIDFNDLWMNVLADVSGTSAGATNLSVDPLLANPDDEDYHLTGQSALIDAGTTDGAPGVDVDGDPRPIDGDNDGSAGVDIGADEYWPPTPTATPTATATPTVTVTPTPHVTPSATPSPTPERLYLPLIRKA
jgi:parallel beta-helix repeat protein/predicted outer membrane repeat protein